MTKVTIKSLQDQLATALASVAERGARLSELRSRAEAAEKDAKLTRQQFDDLKRRLHDAEVENARLNGYVARVREDDTVREELVTVGEPGGPQRLVPKRKPEILRNIEPDTYTDFRERNPYYTDHDSPKPKHWIEY